MFSARGIERSIYRNPEVETQDYESYPMQDEMDMMFMETEYFSESDKVHIFPYVSCTENGLPYIELYVWDCMLYPFVFKRYLICEGKCLSEEAEEELLHYIKEAKCRDAVVMPESFMEKLHDGVSKYFPSWHYINYSPYHVSEALTHLDFASHRSGVREILYKAQLYNIAYNIEAVPGYNMIGSNPTAIIGYDLPLKLLRILNLPSLIHNLFAEDTIEMCRNVYTKYSDYIGKDKMSSAQWSYLEMLCMNNGKFGGQGFNRALYNRLETVWGDDIVCEYGRFLELKDKMPGIKVRMPRPYDVEETVGKLATAYDYKTGKATENNLIRSRSKNSNYEYASGDYLMKMPTDGLDMCMEAINQGNCLVSYIRSHANAETTIVFLRERSKPSESFVTVEISRYTIAQVYARYNSFPNKEVYVFLEEYAKVKGLNYDPCELILENMDDMDDCDLEEELMEYVSDYEKRHQWKPFPCEEIEYHQMTIDECFPNFIMEVVGCA